MIFITAKFRVLPEHADDLARDLRGPSPRPPAPRTGCLWFDWSRSLDDPNEYVLVEAFRDGDAGAAHVLRALQGRPGRAAAVPGRDARDRQPDGRPGRLERAGGDAGRLTLRRPDRRGSRKAVGGARGAASRRDHRHRADHQVETHEQPARRSAVTKLDVLVGEREREAD